MNNENRFDSIYQHQLIQVGEVPSRMSASADFRAYSIEANPIENITNFIIQARKEGWNISATVSIRDAEAAERILICVEKDRTIVPSYSATPRPTQTESTLDNSRDYASGDLGRVV